MTTAVDLLPPFLRGAPYFSSATNLTESSRPSLQFDSELRESFYYIVITAEFVRLQASVLPYICALAVSCIILLISRSIPQPSIVATTAQRFPEYAHVVHGAKHSGIFKWRCTVFFSIVFIIPMTNLVVMEGVGVLWQSDRRPFAISHEYTLESSLSNIKLCLIDLIGPLVPCPFGPIEAFFEIIVSIICTYFAVHLAMIAAVQRQAFEEHCSPDGAGAAP